MKNTFRSILVTVAVVILVACGHKDPAPESSPIPTNPSTSTTSATNPSTTGSPANTGRTECPDFSGTYYLAGVGTLAIKQTGCVSISYNESCTGDAYVCRDMGVAYQADNVQLGDQNSRHARWNGSSILLSENGGRKSISISSHPCSNDFAGLEIEFHGSGTTGQCQPWIKY